MSAGDQFRAESGASEGRELARMDAESQRKLFFKNLSAALWCKDKEGDGNGTFAGGGAITQNQQDKPLLESVHVEGVGEWQLPLSSEDFVKLLGVSEQAPYGHGFATVLNPTVRNAWQVDSSKVTFPQSPDFVNKIRLLANKAVRALGLDGAALQLEAHLYKLLLYEVDGHFSLHRDTEKEPGMFATLILQLPTQEGFEGGALLVRHNGVSKTFKFSSESAIKFFYTVFYADCQHELRRITTGKRVCLAFNLVRGKNVMQIGNLKEFSSRLSKVEAALLPWRNTEGSRDVFPSDKLAIPLHHKYSKKNLSFSGLKGDDSIVAHVLKNCRDDMGRPWLDLYLCIYTLRRTGEPEGSDYSYRRKYDDDSDDDADDDIGTGHCMGEVLEEDFESSNWVQQGDKGCHLSLEIMEEDEVVVGEGQMVFGEHGEPGEPDEVDYEGYTGNAGPTLDYRYHKAMLVIWPRKKTIAIAGIAGAVNSLKTRVIEGDSEIVTMLQEAVSYCERNVGNESLAGLAGLLQVSVMAGGLGEVVRVLKLLSEPYNIFDQERTGHTVGIVDTDSATAIARAVHTHGWVNCGPFVLNMLVKEQVMNRGTYFAHLALELHKLGCEDAGLLVARRTLGFVLDSPLEGHESEMIVSMGKLIFHFQECASEMGLIFVERLGKLSTDVLCSFVTKLFAFSSEEGTVESSSVLFRRICQVITTRDFHRPTMLESHIVKLVSTFSLVGDEQLFSKLIQALLDQSRIYKVQNLLQRLLGSDPIWTALSGTDIGRSSLKLLAEERILVLSRPGPPFTWCMPRAQFPRHPDVQAFLRGPSESLRYTGVNDSKHASNFARKYFGHSGYRDGYSATAFGHTVLGISTVTIQKTRTAFQHQVAERMREQQEELPRLRQRLQKLQNAPAAGNGAGVEVVVLSPDASMERQKRRKVQERKVENTEYIDLSLDD